MKLIPMTTQFDSPKMPTFFIKVKIVFPFAVFVSCYNFLFTFPLSLFGFGLEDSNTGDIFYITVKCSGIVKKYIVHIISDTL